jgi:hypothetical protein
MFRFRTFAQLVLVAAAVVSSAVAYAQPPQRANPGFDFVTKYCVACHDAESSAGKLDLSRFSDASSMLAARGVWTKVLCNVRSGEMPPRDANQRMRTGPLIQDAWWSGGSTARNTTTPSAISA